MIFENITENEYEKFWNIYDKKCFLSSIEIGHLREKNNWHISYVGLKENNKIIACAMLLFKKRHFNKYEYYAIRGPLIDYSNFELLKIFFSELKAFIKKNNGYILRIDPYIIDYQRDIDGNIIKSGINNSKIITYLNKIGFKKNNNDEQNNLLFTLNLKSKSENDILNEMKSNTRNIINKALKSNIKIKELNYNELNIFYDILKKTGDRKNFKIKSFNYYQNMFKIFKNKIKFLITEIDLNENNILLKEELKNKEIELNKLSNAKYNNGKKNNIKNEIASIKKKITYNNEIIEKTKRDNIIMSSSVFIIMKPEIVYLSSGNIEKYLKFNSQYALQWEMIKYAINNGFDKYNFYGIITYDDKKNKDYGIYEFKRGFNGNVEKLIGEYELPISKEYYFIKIIRKIKNLFRR
ncbi:MAG: peptidoglycan bridge formation glycyltransferase FemA/FemB family protein [bacterium]|nr:peptidoglycan bridge formation glycyltransferase FemA/FemB family protein [bacterium]